MRQPLAITGCALLTPLDGPTQTTWSAIRAGKSVGTQVAVNDRLLDADESLDRSIRLALAVAKQALAGKPTDNTALFCGTSKGPVGTMLQALQQFHERKPLNRMQATHIALGVGAMGTLVAERLNLPAGHTSVAACSSGLHALHRAAQSIWRGECRRALVVAADASLHPLFPASFARLGVLSPTDPDGIRHCRPFSPDGQGFFLIEAAAALLLEDASVASDIKPLAMLTDSWIGGDASALIAIDSSTNSLRHGLSRVATTIKPPISFIHAHATGTTHDLHELQAIKACVPSEVCVFSHKEWLGHSLGAAGLVSLALSIACHQNQMLPTGDPIPKLSSSLTLAQGFGGHIAIAALRGI